MIYKNMKNGLNRDNRRQVLVINGKDSFDPLYNKPAMDCGLLIGKLSGRDDIEMISVGSGCKDITIGDIEGALSKLDTNEKITIIIQCHGVIKNGEFYFILGDDVKISSSELFEVISDKLGCPVDIFTPACYGGGMMSDRGKLPAGSVLVSLTSDKTVNSGGDYGDMVKQLDKFSGDFSAYNLLQFYLLNFLRNRFHPFVAVSDGETYDLDYMLEQLIKSKDIEECDINSIKSLMLDKKKIKRVYQKLLKVKNSYGIYADEYGTALALVFEDLLKRDKALYDSIKNEDRRFAF